MASNSVHNFSRMTSDRSASGYLELILGPMFSGKTSRLVEIYNQCTFCHIPVLVINHVIDNRYDDELLSTHDKIKIPCTRTNKLSTVAFDTAEVVLINEGQFFPDLFEVVSAMLVEKKKVYVCGLDGDFQCRKFGALLDLIPHCDKVTKLSSLCSLCRDGTPAIFSKRITAETAQTVVGADNYIPVCRTHYGPIATLLQCEICGRKENATKWQTLDRVLCDDCYLEEVKSDATSKRIPSNLYL